MRSFIVVSVMLLTIIFLVILNSVYVCDICNELSSLSDIILRDDDKSHVQTLCSIWEKHRGVMSISIELDEIERMNDLTEALKASAERSEHIEVAKNCRLIKDLCEEFSEFERLSFNSIF